MRPIAPALVLLTLACAGHGPPRNPGVRLHGEVTDPSGDASLSPHVPHPPDLVGAIVDIADDRITFTVRFAPGTYDRLTTSVAISLDTDLNPATGRWVNGVGADYSVGMGQQFYRDHASLERATTTPNCPQKGPCWESVGQAPVTFLSDGMSVTFPLALFHGTDGRLDFRVAAYVKPDEEPFSIVVDHAPNTTLPPGHVR